MEKMTDMRKGL